MNQKRKEYGVIYTPQWVVDLILDAVIKNDASFPEICDPACGEGAFLERVVDRICVRVPPSQRKVALQKIVGFDLDEEALERCRSRLNAVLRMHKVKSKVVWNLHCLDSTSRNALAEFANRFDVVVGNPPYVRIQHLGETRRAKLLRDWTLTRCGSTDLYIAFFEIGMHLLKSGGLLGYITPNTFVKTAAGQPLRNLILQNRIERWVDFGSHQVFPDATTYSLISVLRKSTPSKKFRLFGYDGIRVVDKGMVSVANLPKSGIWSLQDEQTLHELRKLRMRGLPLRKVADIHVGLQTLADDIYILRKTAETDGIVTALDINGNLVRIESDITRPILKASVLKDGKDASSRVIIFPYDETNHNCLFEEQNLQRKFPLAYEYLLAHKMRLLERDKGRFPANRWYAFGREFGLESTFGEKILTSGMNPQPNFQKCPAAQYTFYAGYCVKPKAGVDIDQLLRALNSAEMEYYIRHISRDYQNGWKSYAKSFIGDFGIPPSVYAQLNRPLQAGIEIPTG